MNKELASTGSATAQQRNSTCLALNQQTGHQADKKEDQQNDLNGKHHSWDLHNIDATAFTRFVNISHTFVATCVEKPSVTVLISISALLGSALSSWRRSAVFIMFAKRGTVQTMTTAATIPIAIINNKNQVFLQREEASDRIDDRVERLPLPFKWRVGVGI
jgi:hypothetical protein